MPFALLEEDFSEVSTSAKEIVGHEIKFLVDGSERQRLSKTIDDLTGAKSVDMDTAVKRCCQRNSSWSLSTTIRDNYEAQSWNHSERAAQRFSL